MKNKKSQKSNDKTEKLKEIMSAPIDYEKLENDGFIKIIGKTIYAGDKPLEDFPENAKARIKQIFPKNKSNLVKITFYK